MSGFSEILNRLGFGKKKDEKEAKASGSVETKRPSFERTPSEKAATSKAPVQRASSRGDMEMVDVVAKLEGMAKANAEELDWKVSIVDLLKLLGMDSSREARTELAKELGIPAEKLEDSADMNVWLHKKVLQEIAANGGNVPKELLD